MIGAPARLHTLGADEFEGYASLFGVPDGAGDVVAHGAFARSLRKRGRRQRCGCSISISRMNPSACGRRSARMRAGFTCAAAWSPMSSAAREVARAAARGALNGLSIGFRTRRARPRSRQRHSHPS